MNFRNDSLNCRWPRSRRSGSASTSVRRRPTTGEAVDSSYVSRMDNLTTLAPDIVASILDEALPPEVTLYELAVDPPSRANRADSRIMPVARHFYLVEKQFSLAE
jgi:hypothetical protein